MVEFLKAPRAVAGILSFLLPGLGHLYGSRVGLALLWFTPFLFLLLAPLPSILLFVLATCSSWDAYRLDLPEGNASRRFLFATAGICAFLFWSITLSPVLRPIEGQLAVQRSAQAAATQVRECRQKLGRYPAHLGECPSLTPPLDPWGHPFRYDRSRMGKGGFRLRSRGADGEWGGSDDTAFRFR